MEPVELILNQGAIDEETPEDTTPVIHFIVRYQSNSAHFLHFAEQ
jgi:hypothetical protein